MIEEEVIHRECGGDLEYYDAGSDDTGSIPLLRCLKCGKDIYLS